MPDLVVAGAGMAGLVAAAEAASRGARVVVHEKGDRPGGSMLLSSGVVWRYRRFEDFRRECPDGTPELQSLVHERLDDDLAWLEGLGARVLDRSTGNPRTVGLRFDTRSLVDALTAHGGELRLRDPLREIADGAPVVLATGGFQANRDLVRRWITPEADGLFLRAAPWSTGDGLRLGLDAGASTTNGMGELYGRAMPAPPARIPETQFVELAQLYARHAVVESVAGERYEPRTWSEIDVVQWLARQRGARGIYRVAAAQLAARVRDRTVGEMVDGAVRAGAPVRRFADGVAVEVVAGITTTLGGLAVDRFARAAPGVYAAGADVGGIATGGYASGLAAALVLGRIAAASALEGR
ncbi:FAD-dependent oxidoreductase [Gaiella sp.]|jgi:succinate dehydrogenase/fumarate reductase flavoprotein subunit|uniref:FAD-dependent oxidoreductase n=1 Tax=Gaiella sp. TaxID=2663207 RepID=UPI002B64465E|nr:FAD-dependent oxidoreductase [Gaiella sp.]HWO80533.1 FAD-dependent oxidoreductase [Gaiella sp.]